MCYFFILKLSPLHNTPFLQGHIKYPVCKLKGEAIKSTVSARLVEPVRSRGDYAIAFRVVWRVHEVKLAHAWNAIVAQRHLCDHVVAQTPSLQMFVSCISGVFSKGANIKAGTRPVYPAVSYWAVLDGGTVNGYGDLGTRIATACPFVEIKPIRSQQRRQPETLLATECEPLYIALKDHNSSFVIQKITSSLLATGAVSVAWQPINAKMIALSHSTYLQQLPAAIEALKTAGLCIVLEVLDDGLEPIVSSAVD